MSAESIINNSISSASLYHLVNSQNTESCRMSWCLFTVTPRTPRRNLNLYSTVQEHNPPVFSLLRAQSQFTPALWPCVVFTIYIWWAVIVPAVHPVCTYTRAIIDCMYRCLCPSHMFALERRHCFLGSMCLLFISATSKIIIQRQCTKTLIKYF